MRMPVSIVCCFPASGKPCDHVEQDAEERDEELEAHDDRDVEVRIVMREAADGEQRDERAAVRDLSLIHI